LSQSLLETRAEVLSETKRLYSLEKVNVFEFSREVSYRVAKNHLKQTLNDVKVALGSTEKESFLAQFSKNGYGISAFKIPECPPIQINDPPRPVLNSFEEVLCDPSCALTEDHVRIGDRKTCLEKHQSRVENVGFLFLLVVRSNQSS
jgi:hypothetical protein